MIFADPLIFSNLKISPDGIFMNEFRTLMYALEHGMIDLAYIQAKVQMNRRKEILSKHPYKIWESKDGKWYTYIKIDDKRKLIKRTSRQAIEDKIISLHEDKEPSLEDIFEEWNNWRLESCMISDASHKRYADIFKKHYVSFGKKKFKELDPDELLDFLESQVSIHKLTAKSFSNLKTVTRGLCKRAKRMKLIDWNVEEILSDLDVSDKNFVRTAKTNEQEVYSEDEWLKMTSYLINNEDLVNLGLLLLFATGMRVGELAALKPEDVNTDGTISIKRTETSRLVNKHYEYCVRDFPKTAAGVRMVVVPSEYIWVLKRLKMIASGCKYVFEKNGVRIHEQAFRRRLKMICEKIGIEPKSPHKVRKTYGTILLDNNVDRRFILDQMGHVSITTTENHYHRNRKAVEKKREVLNQLPEFKKRQPKAN